MASVILFDIASGDKETSVCWNFNPWKTRLVLNYKQIPYETQFLEYPEIAPTLRGFGVPPNESGTAYTIPTIKLTSTSTYIVDSAVIAAKLEELHPTPSLYLDAPELQEVYAAFGRAFKPIIMVIMPRVIRNIVGPESAKYLRNSVKKDYGKEVEEVEAERGGFAAIEKTRESFQEMDEIVTRKGGPLILGDTPSYADFVLVAGLLLAKRAGDDVYSGIVDNFPALERLFGACMQWSARDDH